MKAEKNTQIEPMRILIVDDEKISRDTMCLQLRKNGYEACVAEDGDACLKMLETEQFDVVLTDLRMPGKDGLTVVVEIKEKYPFTDVMVMTAYGTLDIAIDAVKKGAVDYLAKPFRFGELQLRLQRLADERYSHQELHRLRRLLADTSEMGIVGKSAAMYQIRERIRRFATNRSPVLITGETGTGKEVVARAIHAASDIRHRKFTAVACGAIPRDLAEAYLFGHEKGAFTGAQDQRTGCFEQADGGTLLLDDIDDLPLEQQANLVRVLQEGVIRRIGGSKDLKVQVRVIATTKQDLEQLVAANRFRSDLYYRIRGLEIMLPPLCERREDIELLCTAFLSRIAQETHTDEKSFSAESVEALITHSWPGNVRELVRTIESSVALADGRTIEARDLPVQVLNGSPVTHPVYSLDLRHHKSIDFVEVMDNIEREIIEWALRKAHGSKTTAAKILGIPRTSLQSKLARTKTDSF